MRLAWQLVAFGVACAGFTPPAHRYTSARTMTGRRALLEQQPKRRGRRRRVADWVRRRWPRRDEAGAAAPVSRNGAAPVSTLERGASESLSDAFWAAMDGAREPALAGASVAFRVGYDAAANWTVVDVDAAGRATCRRGAGQRRADRCRRAR